LVATSEYLPLRILYPARTNMKISMKKILIENKNQKLLIRTESESNAYALPKSN
jgi:hypothetical protein